MCARHDITIGRYLIEVDPWAPDKSDKFLLYVNVTSLDDGSLQWQGAITFSGAPTWDVEAYGGSQLVFEGLSNEVESS